MNIITLDFETHFSDDYSLSKMTTEAYVRDPRFEALGCGIQSMVGFAHWESPATIHGALRAIDWSNTAVLCHHAQFDGLILSYHYGIQPKFWFDTLSMARLLVGNHLSVGLDALAKHFGLAAKTVPYSLFKGKHWHELAPAVQQQVADGCLHDVELTWQLFNILGKDFPRSEYEVVNATVRMFTEPALRADTDLLADVWEREAKAKTERMQLLGVTEELLQSTNLFAQLLRQEGIEPQRKEGKNGEIYAFAKTDQFMRDLQEHDNDRVRLLAEARLGAKSTLLQTRAETLGWMARRGPMPVYLRYAGAHTTRWSGGDGANWQNFKRGSDIRRAIMAPEGYLLGTIDMAQIECRILCYLAGEETDLEAFRDGEDLYADLASRIYGFTVTKEHPKERGTGKQLILSCGYQAGAKTIQNTARLGIYGPPVDITLETATVWRDLYRQTHPQVVAYWKEAGALIPRIGAGETRDWAGEMLDWGPMQIRNSRIYGPGGTMLIYDTLEWHIPTPEEQFSEYEANGFWRFQTRQGWTRLYSGKLVENVVQWLARIVLSQALTRIVRLGYRVVNCTHDELLILIPQDGREQEHLDRCTAEMKREPAWLPGIPLDAEASLGERYSK